MKNLLNRTLSVICAVMLLISAVFTWAIAEEEPATPTDLIPSEGEIIPEEPGKEPEPEGETGEEGITSVEVVITKTLTVGQNWEGKMKKTKPAVLKLDVTRPGLVYMLVEGKDVWATVEKSDRLTENPSRTKTDSETERMVISWEAEEGSYLITLGPVEPNVLAIAKVTFMDKQAYDAWEKEQEEETEEPEVEPLDDETMLGMGYYKVQVIGQNGADAYDSIGGELVKHYIYGKEAWVKATQSSEWAEVYKTGNMAARYVKWEDLLIVLQREKEEPAKEFTEEKPAVEDSVKEEEQSEINKTDTEKEAEEEPTELPDDQTMLKMGYYKVQIAMSSGADIYSEKDSTSEVLDHMAVASECWLKETENPEWAQIFTTDEDESNYLLWDKVIITMRPEKQNIEIEESDTDENTAEDIANENLTENKTADNNNPELCETDEDGLEKNELPNDESELNDAKDPEGNDLPARYVEINSTLSNMRFISVGQQVTMTAQLFNFRDDDICSFQWQYYDRASGNYIDIEDATDSTYIYYINDKNISFFWRLVVVIDSNDE